jgi:oligosaccharide repeat unit polymerase
MSSLDLVLIFFLLLAVLNYRAQHSVLYPPFIFCAMWLLDLAVVRSGIIEIDPVHGNTLAIVATGAASFSAGGLLAGLVPRELLRVHIHLFPPRPEGTPNFLRNTLTIIVLCGLPLIFYQIWQFINLQGGNFFILTQARMVQVEVARSGEQSLPVTMLSYFLMTATSASLLFATEKIDRQFWVVTVVAFLTCILSTGRTGFLILISGLCAIRLLRRKQESLRDAMRLLRWPIALFVALYIGIALTNKNTARMTGGITDIVTYSVLSYIAGPLAAFDGVVQNPAGFMMTTSHTFQYPLRLAAALHLANYTRPPAFDSFVFVPFPINVYTVFKFYFLELGTAGTAVILLFVGFLHSLLYLKAKQGGRFSIYLFARFMYPVLMVTFDDQYYLMGMYLVAIAFALLYFLIGSVPLRLFPVYKQENLSSQTEP